MNNQTFASIIIRIYCLAILLGALIFIPTTGVWNSITGAATVQLQSLSPTQFVPVLLIVGALVYIITRKKLKR